MSNKLQFKEGDNIAGKGITTGKYLGLVKLYEKKFHKVFDSNKSITVFLPFDSFKSLRRLPSEKTVKDNLETFKQEDLIDAKKIEGSRYKYLKEKLKKNTFKQSIEVLHDLNILMMKKKASVAERRLYLNLKEQVLYEVSFILNISKDEIEGNYLKCGA